MNCKKKKKKKNAFRIAIFRPATGNRLVFFFFFFLALIRTFIYCGDYFLAGCIIQLFFVSCLSTNTCSPGLYHTNHYYIPYPKIPVIWMVQRVGIILTVSAKITVPGEQSIGVERVLCSSRKKSQLQKSQIKDNQIGHFVKASLWRISL